MGTNQNDAKAISTLVSHASQFLCLLSIQHNSPYIHLGSTRYLIFHFLLIIFTQKNIAHHHIPDLSIYFS